VSRQKLSPAQRTELVQRRKAGTRIKVLVRDYGVSPNYITRHAGAIYPEMSRVARERTCS
jgi:hypothetical protein